jgi:O-6-methylguanine DNA methyltransferase
MKEQIQHVILPELPIVGTLQLSSRDGKTISAINVVKKQKASKLDAFFEMCFVELKAFLSGETQELHLPLDFSGMTLFQRRVLKEMKKIPYGEVQSYRDLAQRLKSRGYQAIGTACGRNPFMLIYPCHRVVGSKDLGGFAHGLKMKKDLLKLEGYTQNQEAFPQI